jgi:very-short-patch-repair endonuclease
MPTYSCPTCDNKQFRDKTGYTKHCSTRIHTLRSEGLSLNDAKQQLSIETSKKISESNKRHAETHENPRKGVKLTEEQRNKCREVALKRLYGEDIKYLTETHPDIAKEWHPTRNGTKLPNQFTKSSNEMIVWLCPNTCNEGCLHEYEQTICNRTAGESCCPYCSTPRKKVCIHDSIVSTHPDIAKELHPTKNPDIRVGTISYGSKLLLWWLCPNKCPHGCLHEYQNSPLGRCGINKQNCPFCCNQQICFHSSIEHTHPDIAKQWHSTKNGTDLPVHFSKGNTTKKFWWICDQGHEYDALIKNRANGSGCPVCKHKTEQILSNYLLKHIPDITTQDTIICPGRKFDNVSYSKQLIVELDGPQHFKHIPLWKNDPDANQEIDVFKMKVASDKGYRIIRLLQEDVLKNGESFLDTHLKPLLESGREVEYISPFNTDIYDKHRQKMCASTSHI